jgi:hypothetical protein
MRGARFFLSERQKPVRRPILPPVYLLGTLVLMIAL